jgi:hypothetical protein
MKDLAHLLMGDYAAFIAPFTDIVSALLSFLTLPVTVTTAEQSVSKLHLIESYLRSTKINFMCWHYSALKWS